MYSNDYLLKNGITDIEELVGKSVYFIFPVQGIVKHNIRRVQYGKQQEWFLCVPETYKVSELGESIFFTKEEAEKYQLQQIYEYTKEQQELVVGQKIKERNTELEELNRLLTKYPNEESRKEIYLCEICKITSIQDRYDVDDYRYWLCEDCKNYNNFKCDINEVMKLFGKSDKDKE